MTRLRLSGLHWQTEFQSTCHIRGMTGILMGRLTRDPISIHMPHTWHDIYALLQPAFEENFNPHATYVA